MKNYTLLDAEKQNAKYPDTFEIPDLADRLAIPVGQWAKLCFESADGGERMWVKVTVIRTDADGTTYTGTLDNEPVVIPRLRLHDEVTFSPQHVLDIMGA